VTSGAREETGGHSDHHRGHSDREKRGEETQPHRSGDEYRRPLGAGAGLPGAVLPERRTDDPIAESSLESFPASDPPAWTPTTTGNATH